MDLDEAYEPYLFIRHAKWLGIPPHELMHLPQFWIDWAVIGEAAEAKAEKEANKQKRK